AFLLLAVLLVPLLLVLGDGAQGKGRADEHRQNGQPESAHGPPPYLSSFLSPRSGPFSDSRGFFLFLSSLGGSSRGTAHSACASLSAAIMKSSPLICRMSSVT